MVKETVILFNYEFRKNEEKWNLFVSLIDLIVMKTLLTARLPVTVSSVKTWSQAYGKKFSPGHTATPEGDICSVPYTDHDDTHLIIVCGAPRPTACWGNNSQLTSPHHGLIKRELHVKKNILLYVRVWAGEWCDESLSGQFSFLVRKSTRNGLPWWWNGISNWSRDLSSRSSCMYKYMSWLRGNWRSRDQLEIPICHQGAPFLVDFLSLRKETCMAGKTFTTPLTTPKPNIPLYVKVHMEFPFKGESYQSCLWLHQSRGGGGWEFFSVCFFVMTFPEFCSAKVYSVVAEFFVRVKISYSSVSELSYAIDFGTAREVSHTLCAWFPNATKIRTFSRKYERYEMYKNKSRKKISAITVLPNTLLKWQAHRVCWELALMFSGRLSNGSHSAPCWSFQRLKHVQGRAWTIYGYIDFYQFL